MVGTMPVRVMPSVEQILDHLEYDDVTGIFTYRNNPSFEPGCKKADGYVVIRLPLTGSYWPAHRLAWKIVTGNDPVGVIDHINGVRDDNRIDNLRDVSPEVNGTNVVHGRWRNTLASRKAAEKARKKAIKVAKEANREERERALLAELKAKYEGYT
jgi:hypothetical protein